MIVGQHLQKVFSALKQIPKKCMTKLIADRFLCWLPQTMIMWIIIISINPLRHSTTSKRYWRLCYRKFETVFGALNYASKYYRNFGPPGYHKNSLINLLTILFCLRHVHGWSRDGVPEDCAGPRHVRRQLLSDLQQEGERAVVGCHQPWPQYLRGRQPIRAKNPISLVR